MLLGEPDAFHFLRSELMEPDSWTPHVSLEDMPDYYCTVVRRLIEIGDRRAVPALIKFLDGGASGGIPEKVLNERAILKSIRKPFLFCAMMLADFMSR